MDDSLFATNTFGLWWVWRPAYPSHLAVVLRSAPKQSVAYVSSSGTSWETGPPPPAALWNKRSAWFGGPWVAGWGFQELRESALLGYVRRFQGREDVRCDSLQKEN